MKSVMMLWKLVNTMHFLLKSMLEIEACVTIRKEFLIIFAMQMQAQELVEILTEEEQVMPNELLKMISPSNKKAKIGN